MSDAICLNPDYSTTRCVTRVAPSLHNSSNARFDGLRLPTHSQRKGEGGLRVQGYFKASNDFGSDATGGVEVDSSPFITVITVVFNGEETLEQTILSVINQSDRNVEYIIIDGGSTDGTLDIIRKYEHAINYWVSEPDLGIYDAMNKGWILANQDSSILYIGSGDQIEHLPLNVDVNKIIYGNVRINNQATYFRSSPRWELHLTNTLHHQALLIPRTFSFNGPFNIKYRVYADFDFNQRLFKQNRKFEFDNSFVSSALPDGVSAKLNVKEMVAVVHGNYGIGYALISFLYLAYIKFRVSLHFNFKCK